MVIEVVKELEAAKAKVVELEHTLEKELTQKLSRLPSEFGFDSLPAFIKALKNAAGARKSRGAGKAPKGEKGGKRSKRARLTPELKNEVKSLVGDGKTGAQIAKQLGISVPSVQNIKKEFGLVKSRRK